MVRARETFTDDEGLERALMDGTATDPKHYGHPALSENPPTIPSDVTSSDQLPVILTLSTNPIMITQQNPENPSTCKLGRASKQSLEDTHGGKVKGKSVRSAGRLRSLLAIHRLLRKGNYAERVEVPRVPGCVMEYLP
ncbi:uncharacterized protein LOC119569442, partial [Penaeus monodon]|uniref:uncharacterized protein LOC119569442 n=1 Tax=Penaeus monodon TaxID=6687 RepID=UPI0018A7810E